MIHIKNIQPEHVEMFWKLRLEALKTHPAAFGSSYEDSVGTPLNEVVKRIKNEKDNYILGAHAEDGQLVGMVGFVRESGMKLKHKGTIWGVYVSPAYRRRGIAKTLLQEVLTRGKEIEGLKQIHLSVVTANKTASEQYKKLGFETYGIEKNALVYKGQGYDEELMAYYY